MKIAVIGGGVSGIRAALTLARAGHAVSLIEKNRFLGGRTFSFPTPDFGEVDIGQHVWLKCCTALEQLIRDLEVPAKWVYRQSEFCILYRRPGKPSFRLQSAPLPWLLHLLPDLLRFPGMKAADVAALLFGMGQARLYSDQALEALDSISFRSWLNQHNQPPETVTRLWEPLVLAVCNQRADDVSARHGLFTFRESLLKSRHAADICFFRRPLSEVFDRHTRLVLSAGRVELLLGTQVRAVQPGANCEVSLQRNEALERRVFDRIVLALPLSRAQQLIRPSDPLPQPPGNTPIAGLLLKMQRPVMNDLFFAALESPVQWVFNKTAIWTGKNAEADGSQVLEVIISGAEKESRMGGEDTANQLVPGVAALLPQVRNTPILSRRFLLHGAATFAVDPGSEARRVQPLRPEFPNIVFAGDGAATGWPSTMESAVRAGQNAAEALLPK